MNVALLLAAVLVQDEARDVEVVRTWNGSETKIETAESHRITDSEAWTKVWERHAGKNQRAPEVDFGKHMVVAVFLGPRTFHDANVYSVKQTRDEIVFGVVMGGEDCCDFSRQPLYCIAVIPKSSLKLSVIGRVKQELDVDPRKDELLKEFPAIEK